MRQNKFPVRRKFSFARAFGRDGSRRAAVCVLNVKARLLSRFVAADENVSAVSKPLRGISSRAMPMPVN